MSSIHSTNENGVVGKLCSGYKCNSHWCPLSNFNMCNNRVCPDGLHWYCKDCRSESSRDSYFRNRDARLKQTNMYQATTKGKEVLKNAITKYHQTEKGIKARKKASKKHWKENKSKALKTQFIRRNKRIDILKINGCAICGYYNKNIDTDCKDALDFHHVKPEDKEFGINSPNMDLKVERIIAEVNKCILLCKNCHSEIESK